MGGEGVCSVEMVVGRWVVRIGQTKARQQLVSRECGGAGVRLWGQGELSQGQPAALVTITNNELTGWGGGRLMGNYGRVLGAAE